MLLVGVLSGGEIVIFLSLSSVDTFWREDCCIIFQYFMFHSEV